MVPNLESNWFTFSHCDLRMLPFLYGGNDSNSVPCAFWAKV